jgi:hypothetical protein
MTFSSVGLLHDVKARHPPGLILPSLDLVTVRMIDLTSGAGREAEAYVRQGGLPSKSSQGMTMP